MDEHNDQKKWPTLSGVPEETRGSNRKQTGPAETHSQNSRSGSRNSASNRANAKRTARTGQKDQQPRTRADHARLVREREEREEREARGNMMKQWLVLGGAAAVFIIILIIAVVALCSAGRKNKKQETTDEVVTSVSAETESETESETEETVDLSAIAMPDYVTVDYIEPNEFSRPQKPLTQVNDIVVHYVGNPGTSAAANVSYFKGLADQDPAAEDAVAASSHFVIGLEGEIINCIPLDEVSYCSNNRNSDTIAIEVCHPDETGKFNDVTYTSLIKLLTYLCAELNLDETHIIRHYDVTGKICPKYYVENPEAWDQLKLDVQVSLDAYLAE